LKKVDDSNFTGYKPLQQRVTGLITKDLLMRVSAFRKISSTVMNKREYPGAKCSPTDIIVQKGSRILV
jgi:hypothetical protein